MKHIRCRPAPITVEVTNELRNRLFRLHIERRNLFQIVKSGVTLIFMHDFVTPICKVNSEPPEFFVLAQRVECLYGCNLAISEIDVLRWVLEDWRVKGGDVPKGEA